MKTISKILVIVSVVCLVGFIGSLVVEQSYTSRAKTYQLVRKSQEAQLFGEVGDKIGTPQEFIIDDEKAVLPEPLEDGTPALDDGYLKEHNLYPLQLRTVREVAGMSRLAIGAALVVSGLLAVWANKRAKPSS